MAVKNDTMLNKNDMVARLATKGYTKKDADCIISDVFDVLTEIMGNGESVHLHGFGDFTVKWANEREMVDFQTKEKRTVPGHYVARFTPGKLLKTAVAGAPARQ